VNQKAQAIQVMHDALTKRQRVWQPAFEELMKKYIELTVELRKGKLAKDGLHQYRNLCSQANIGSLETIIRYFLQRAESVRIPYFYSLLFFLLSVFQHFLKMYSLFIYFLVRPGGTGEGGEGCDRY
jgi:hypothetical protein